MSNDTFGKSWDLNQVLVLRNKHGKASRIAELAAIVLIYSWSLVLGTKGQPYSRLN